MYLECDCSQVNIDQWNSLMRGARKCSYNKLVRKIKKEMPDVYCSLCLDFPNPWDSDCKQTKTHYILVHSAIEYFIRKE